MASSSSSSPSSSTENLLKTLTTRGWCFNDLNLDQVRAIITVNSAINGDSFFVNSLESELCNVDLRSIGASVKDISRSSEVLGYKGSSDRRLLKLILTDGQSEVTAVEYSPIPALSENTVPGTKVRLEKKVVVHYGIVCLTPDVITVLGGVVESLYEEWQMNLKYSGFARSSLRLGREGDAGGPPPFEKLKIGGPNLGFSRTAASASRNTRATVAKSSRETDVRQVEQKQPPNAIADDADANLKTGSISQRAEEKPTSSDTRPKEVTEYIPIQNQAAAQKLLQKMNNPNHGNERHRGSRYKGRGYEEEKQVFTLEEWERRKAEGNPAARKEPLDLSHDEALARQLQNQFNLEEQEQRGPQRSKAEDIRLSMFSFEKDESGDQG
uniref:RecQ mediated genome instability protein 1 OB-fold domain-containing protein n=1 Tax=Chenopodium quinoa TaxID=63459 RepID=A0A803MQ65_CHEQI